MALLFTPFTCRELELRNRVVMSPMCQYQATEEGHATDWHLMHYGARAAGGTGLIIQEATAVEARGRLSANDLGLYRDDHVPGLKRVVDFCHSQGSKVAVQLAHGGRKAWPGGEQIVGATDQAFSPKHVVPQALDEKGIDKVVKAFATGAQRAVAAGYDALEIHGAHGYLIAQFLSAYSNSRSDAFGGDEEKRMEFLRRVTTAVRQVMPKEMPLILRVSAREYVAQGNEPEYVAKVIKAVQPLGLDIIDVSSGAATPEKPPRVFPGYQVTFAEHIRKATGMPVAAVGRLEDPFLAEACLGNGRADLVCVGRGMLDDPHWAAHAAKRLGDDIEWGYRGSVLR